MKNDVATLPDGHTVRYEFDREDRTVKVTDQDNNVTNITYDVNNRVVGVTKPDGSVTTTVYDNKQRETSTAERTATGAVKARTERKAKSCCIYTWTDCICTNFGYDFNKQIMFLLSFPRSL